jgi:hypothetical protein
MLALFYLLDMLYWRAYVRVRRNMKLEDILGSGNDAIIKLNTGFYYTVRRDMLSEPESPTYYILKGRIGFTASIERYPAPLQQVLAFFADVLTDTWEVIEKK